MSQGLPVLVGAAEAAIGPFREAFATKVYGRKSYRAMNGFESTVCHCTLRPAQVGCAHRRDVFWRFVPCAAHVYLEEALHEASDDSGG